MVFGKGLKSLVHGILGRKSHTCAFDMILEACGMRVGAFAFVGRLVFWFQIKKKKKKKGFRLLVKWHGTWYRLSHAANLERFGLNGGSIVAGRKDRQVES